MNIIGKFGNKIIVQQSISKITEMKEWTENKIYKSATHVEIAPVFSIEKDELSESLLNLRKGKASLESQIANFNHAIDDMTYSILRLEQIQAETSENYNSFHFSEKSCNQSFQTFKKMMSSLKGIDNHDMNWINAMSHSEYEKIIQSSSAKITSVIRKYVKEIIPQLNFLAITKNEYEDLIKYCQGQDKPVTTVKDINSFDYSEYSPSKNTNLSNNSIASKNTNKNWGSSNNLVSQDSDKALEDSQMMFNDFRSYVKNYNLANDEITNYFAITADIEKAAELYFQNIYQAEKLKVIFCFSDKTEVPQEFSFISSPGELFAQIYFLRPDANEPKLFLPSGLPVKFNEDTDKFIGGMKLQQGVRIIVKI